MIKEGIKINQYQAHTGTDIGQHLVSMDPELLHPMGHRNGFELKLHGVRAFDVSASQHMGMVAP